MMVALLIVLSLSLILTVGILCTFPLKVDRFYLNASRPQYMTGMSESSWVLLWRITNLMSLAGFMLLCSYIVWAALLQPYYYGF